MTQIVFLDERYTYPAYSVIGIYPAFKISFLNNKTSKLSNERHPITQHGSFRGGHLGLRHYDVIAREYTFARFAIYSSADDVLTSTRWRNVT